MIKSTTNRFSKKLLAVICTLSIIACLFTGLSITTHAYSGGAGTESDPYQISTVQDLKDAVISGANNGTYFKMMNDIVVNEGTVDANSTGLTNWYKSNDTGVKSFGGTFDGDNHKIIGLYFNGQTSSWSETFALFPYVKANAVIKNVGLTNSYIKTTNSAEVVGAFIGYTATATVENCYVDNTVTMVSDMGVGLASFITGKNNKVTFKNCYFTANALKSDGVTPAEGSLFARINNQAAATSDGFYTNSATLYSSESNTDLVATNTYYLGQENATYTTNGATAVATIDLMQGEAAVNNMPGLFGDDSAFKTVDGATPILKTFIDTNGFAAGQGTEEEPWIIENETQLRKCVTMADTEGKFFELANDIAVATSGWYYSNASDIAAFQGTFDGKGHVVSGISFSNGGSWDQASGLFPLVDAGAVIKNVGLTNSTLTSTASASNMGAIVGLATGAAEIRGCYADETVTLNAVHGAGLIGFVNNACVKVYDSYFKAVTNTAGSLAGRTQDTIGEARAYNFYTDKATLLGPESNAPLAENNPFNCVYYVSETTLEGAGYAGTTNFASIESMTGEAARTNMPGIGDNETWYIVDGKTPILKAFLSTNGFASGYGLASDPWMIATKEQLEKAITMGDDSAGKYFKLANDIAINEGVVDGSTTLTNWYDSDDGMRPFKGNFDGNGFVVSGLYYNYGTEWYNSTGLFYWAADGAVIKNLGLTNSYLNQGYQNWKDMCMGSIVGYSEDNVTIENCYVASDVKINVKFGYGIVGYVATGTVNINNCYFVATTAHSQNTETTTYDVYGGLIGKCASGQVAVNGFYTDRNTLVGGGDGNLVGTLNNTYYVGTENTSYASKGATAVALADIQGYEAKDTMTAFDFINDWKVVYKSTPVLRMFESAASVPAKAGLYITGQTGRNPGVDAEMEDGFAIYKKGDVEYAAIRVYGEYLAPVKEDGEVDATKIVVKGKVYDIDSRRLVIKKDGGAVINTVGTSGRALSKYWTAEYDANGEYALVNYSVLIKDIPVEGESVKLEIGTEVVYNGCTVSETTDLVGLGENDPTFTAANIYAAYCAQSSTTPTWFTK